MARLHSVLLFSGKVLVKEVDFPAYVADNFHSLAMTEAFDEFCEYKGYTPSRFLFCCSESVDKIVEEFRKWAIENKCLEFEIEADGSEIYL